MNPRLRNVVLIAGVACVVGGFVAGNANGYSLFPFDFVATYSLSGSSVMFSSEGSLTQIPVCSGAWNTVNETFTPVLSSGKLHKIKVSTLAKRFVIESQSNFVSHSIERVCSGTTVNTNVGTNCAYDDLWSPAVLPSTPRELPNGWSPEGSDSGPLMAGVNDEALLDPNLSFNSLRIDYSVGAPNGSGGAVPFTGRMHFAEYGNSDDIYSEDYIAGFCAGADASPEGCCVYTPTVHSVGVAARPTTFGAPALGSWQQHLMACNVNCN